MPRAKFLTKKPTFLAVVGWNLCLLALVLALPEPFAYGQVKLYEGRELIAALELQSFSQQLTSEQVQYLTDAVRKALADAIDPEKYVVMTRESMDVLIPPEERKCLNDACYAVVGKRLQARLLIAGNVKDLGKRFGVTLEAYDGPTGAVLGIEQGEGQDIDELLEKVRAMARQIVAKVLGTKIPLKPVSPGIPEPLPPSFEEKVTPPKPEEGYLSVEGTPKGAEVLITGPSGPMSLRLPTGPLRVKAGKYSIKVTARDFDEFKEDVFVPADQTKVVTVNLVPSYGQLDIKGTPEGAKTEVSCEKNYKKEVGLPSKLVVPHGMCKIRVTRTGYEPFEREVIVEGGKTTEVPVKLVLESEKARPTQERVSVPVAPEGADFRHRYGATWWSFLLYPPPYLAAVAPVGTRCVYMRNGAKFCSIWGVNLVQFRYRLDFVSFDFLLGMMSFGVTNIGPSRFAMPFLPGEFSIGIWPSEKLPLGFAVGAYGEYVWIGPGDANTDSEGRQLSSDDSESIGHMLHGAIFSHLVFDSGRRLGRLEVEIMAGFEYMGWWYKARPDKFVDTPMSIKDQGGAPLGGGRLNLVIPLYFDRKGADEWCLVLGAGYYRGPDGVQDIVWTFQFRAYTLPMRPETSK